MPNEHIERWLAENPNYFRDLGARNKGVKKKGYVVKPGSLTPAERGRLGGLKKKLSTPKQKRVTINELEGQD